jgi:hypothetical protein
MDVELERRLAANEDVFRKVNEGIERGQAPVWAGGSDSQIAFRCECARLGCNMLLALSLEDYEQVRSVPTRFLVLRGHEMLELERVVKTLGDIVIVEKTGPAGAEATARDPRSHGPARGASRARPPTSTA